jgi:hypothetical protein
MRKHHPSSSAQGLAHTLRVGLPVLSLLLIAVAHLYGYTYSDGTALCTDHAEQLTESELALLNENGPEYAVYSWEELHSDLVCDVPGCGVILSAEVEVQQ